MTVVLDASALLAALNGEPGGDSVASVFDECVIGAVNLAEVAAGLVHHGNNAVQARAVLAALDLEVIAADGELAVDAGLLRAITDSAGLSLGDRFCFAVARRLGAKVLTADRAWVAVAKASGVTVELIR